MFSQNQVKVIMKHQKFIHKKLFHHQQNKKIFNKLNQLQFQQHRSINQQKGKHFTEQKLFSFAFF
jgi:hypothetical protein